MTILMFILSLLGPVPLPIFVLLFALAMLQFGWIGSNFNSIAMEPLGHVAGTASSVHRLHADDRRRHHRRRHRPGIRRHVTPLAAGFCAVSLLALLIVLIAEHGKLFQAHSKPLR